MTFNVTKNGDTIFIKGQVTLPISAKQAKKICAFGYESSPNDGLFEIPGTNKICLSIMPCNVAKIALSVSDLEELKKSID